MDFISYTLSISNSFHTNLNICLNRSQRDKKILFPFWTARSFKCSLDQTVSLNVFHSSWCDQHVVFQYLISKIGTFSNDDGDGYDNVDEKINFYLSYEFREWLDVFSVSNGVKILFLSEYVEAGFSPDRKQKICLRDSRSRKYTECSDFTLLFCRGWLRNVPSFIMHVQNHCSAH